MRVQSSKMRLLSANRYIFRMKFPTGFKYRNLYGFARFPGDSTALASYHSILTGYRYVYSHVISHVTLLDIVRLYALCQPRSQCSYW